jgi:hypothetical protein
MPILYVKIVMLKIISKFSLLQRRRFINRQEAKLSTVGWIDVPVVADDINHLKRYNRILDCPSGASSFVEEANNRYGINTVGCDPLFDKHSRILQRKHCISG